MRKIEQVAPTDATVLIFGETGVGKEILAQAIHDMSPYRDRAMIKVNCAALPSNLIESELFGREKGAYTGALASQKGRFELAHDSTIFLDEIGDLPLELQSKLLRVLQEGEIRRLGESVPRRVDVRIVAAEADPAARLDDDVVLHGRRRGRGGSLAMVPCAPASAARARRP